jgi:UDPglucose 6-dehydrogenase
MICVQGVWHLGAVTAACLADAGFETIGLTDDDASAAALGEARPAVFEPGLSELVREGLKAGRLSFTADLTVVARASLVWVTFDTPVDENDEADIDFVRVRVRSLFDHLADGSVVMLSSQVPVGSTARLAEEFGRAAHGRRVSFAYSPENLRLGQAIDAFQKAERVVVGVSDERARVTIEPVLRRFCPNILWMSIESAEMVKHALNTYLATSIVLTNELATVSEHVGANFPDVERALRLDPRIGQKAYVRAGAAFGGGTLARDVRFLEDLADRNKLKVPLIGAIRSSNANHRDWIMHRLEERLDGLAGKRIGLLGLSYKAGTDAIRRSVAVELGYAISRKGATVVAYDPKVRSLPPTLAASIRAADQAEQAFAQADAVLIGTEWPEFRELRWSDLLRTMRNCLIIDQNGYLSKQIADATGAVEYVALGRGL